MQARTLVSWLENTTQKLKHKFSHRVHWICAVCAYICVYTCRSEMAVPDVESENFTRRITTNNQNILYHIRKVRIYDKRVEVCEQLWQNYEQRRHILALTLYSYTNEHIHKEQQVREYIICVSRVCLSSGDMHAAANTHLFYKHTIMCMWFLLANPNPTTNLPSGQTIHAQRPDVLRTRYIMIYLGNDDRARTTALHKNLRGAQVAEAALVLRGRTLSRSTYTCIICIERDKGVRPSSFAPTNDRRSNRAVLEIETTLSQEWSRNSIQGPQCAFEVSMFMCPAVHKLTRN